MNILRGDPIKTIFSACNQISPYLIGILSSKEPKNRTDRDIKKISEHLK